VSGMQHAAAPIANSGKHLFQMLRFS